MNYDSWKLRVPPRGKKLDLLIRSDIQLDVTGYSMCEWCGWAVYEDRECNCDKNKKEGVSQIINRYKNTIEAIDRELLNKKISSKTRSKLKSQKEEIEINLIKLVMP